MRKPDLLRPTLLAGLLFGALAGLPVTSCCCCLWFIGSGWLAVLLYAQEARRIGYAFGLGEGIRAGLVAGMFGGFITWVIETATNLLFGQHIREWTLGMLEELLRSIESPELENAIREGLQREQSIPGMIFDLVSTLFLFALFSTLAGLVTAAVMNRKRPPAMPGAGPGGGPWSPAPPGGGAGAPGGGMGWGPPPSQAPGGWPPPGPPGGGGGASAGGWSSPGPVGPSEPPSSGSQGEAAPPAERRDPPGGGGWPSAGGTPDGSPGS